MKKTILLAVAAAGIFALTASVQAGEPLFSPKAQEQANSLKTVRGTRHDVINHSVKNGSPKGIAFAESLRKVPSTGNNVDLANATRPTLSPKDPRYETALRENATKSFQVAPLK